MGPVQQVWAIASHLGGSATRQQVLAACALAGINKHTASTQYSRWRAAHGKATPVRRATTTDPASELTHEAALRMAWTTQQRKWPELLSWSLVIDSRTTARLGQCRYRRREVGVSAWHVDKGKWLDVLNTLLHEIAHALAPRGAKHGPEWRQWCLKVGAIPSRLAGEEASSHAPARQVPRKYRVICDVHGDLGGYRRMPTWWKRQTGARCRKCARLVTIVEQRGTS
jgi:hypothetical protein